MSATPLWTVHCSVCARWDSMHDTKREAHKVARRHGWIVRPEENICPTCRDQVKA